MSLIVGQKLLAESLNWELTIRKKLGEGGQGAVFLADTPHGPYVVKWYNSLYANATQRAAILELVKHGPPKKVSHRFVWPKALVTSANSALFGYLMPLIDTQRFAELGDVWARRRPAPDLAALCEISYQIANSFRTLHLDGFCYRDVSKGNLMFDSVSGDVLICDNDNVGVNNASEALVAGTMEYMAPELVRGDAGTRPSTDTDLHSLAVLLFQLWVWHHPLHGQMEYSCKCWDLPAQRRVYGERPAFVFDPHDTSNALPNDPEYKTAANRWKLCPPSLQRQFQRAFSEGLKDPKQRVTEGEWQNVFRSLSDGVVNCACRAANLWDGLAPSAITCWHCRQPVALPPRLVIDVSGTRRQLMLSRAAKIRRRHVEPHADDADAILGEVTPHPTNHQVWGLRNLSASSWMATSPDGTSRDVPPQKSVSMEAGLKLNIAGTMAEVCQ